MEVGCVVQMILRDPRIGELGDVFWGHVVHLIFRVLFCNFVGGICIFFLSLFFSFWYCWSEFKPDRLSVVVVVEGGSLTL